MFVRPHVRQAKVVGTMLEDARRSGLVESNGMRLVRLPSLKGRQSIEPLRPGQVQELVGVAAELFPGVPDVPAAIATAAYTGVRIGELFGLRWEDVDFERYRLQVRRQLRFKVGDEAKPKNGLERQVVLPPVAAEWLRRVARHIDGYVFHTRQGRRMTQSSWVYYWNPVRRVVGLEHVDFHELRHFCGSYLASRGATPRQIAYQLGHTDGGILAAKLYVHDYREEIEEQIGNLFGV